MNFLKKLVTLLAVSSLLAAPVPAVAGFTNIFGGSPVSPSEVAYASYAFNANIILAWPQFAQGSPNVMARFMNVTPGGPGLTMTFPDATLYSVGYDSIVYNSGASSFTIVGAGGNAIVTIAPGQTYYIILSDNTTTNGTWKLVQFGVGASSPDASALAGPGLIDLAGLLAVNLTANNVSNSFTMTPTGRDIIYVWTGGSGTITLPTASSVGNGFLFAVANNGSGTVTVVPTGGNTIDAGVSSAFSQTQSGFVMSNGVNWATVGKGIQNTFAVTLLNLNVAGSSDVTETSAQAQNIIQQYTGLLTGNINVIVPATVQLYFVNNATTGPFTLTLKAAGGSGVAISQGSSAILYCDGTNVVSAFTASITSTVSLVAGSLASPSLSFQGSPSTGIFSGLVNTFSAVANGTEALRWIGATSGVNYLTVTSSATGNSVLIGAAGSDPNIPITISGKGSSPVNFQKVNITGGTIDGTVIGGITPAAITGTTITGASLVGPLTGNATNVTGIVAGPNGGTGVNNGANSIQVTGNFLQSGNHNLNLTLTGDTTVTLPTIGTLAALASPAFTGTPTAPTAAVNTNTTQLATTAFVQAANIKGEQFFTGSGTFTVPSSALTTTQYEFIVTGAGGGSGGVNSGSSGGGGAGSTCIFTSSGLTPGSSVTVNIGAGGTAGTSGPTAGGAGGNSSIVVSATTVTAPGGAGSAAASGTSFVLPGDGGTACTNATLSIPGGGGASGAFNAAVNAFMSGSGGASYWGGGGRARNGGAEGPAAGVAGGAYGSAASGAVASGSAAAGAAGAPGVVQVKWW